MTPCLILVTALAAVASAVRSTWSPCGLSMLSTITPFSERGRGHSYRATATWFVAGATLGGATLGLLMAALARSVEVLHLPSAAAAAAALAAALVTAGSDSGIAGIRLPTHRRQVNERWLDRYRPWVYGAGFGWQIGCGLATFITTAAVYLMIVVGALTGDPMVALAVGTGFGVLRGTAVLLTRHLTGPSELRSFHRRFYELGPSVGRVVVGVELGSAVLIAASARTPSTAVIVALAAMATAGAMATSARHRLGGRSACEVPGHRRPEDAPEIAAAPARRG